MESTVFSESLFVGCRNPLDSDIAREIRDQYPLLHKLPFPYLSTDGSAAVVLSWNGHGQNGLCSVNDLPVLTVSLLRRLDTELWQLIMVATTRLTAELDPLFWVYAAQAVLAVTYFDLVHAGGMNELSQLEGLLNTLHVSDGQVTFSRPKILPDHIRIAAKAAEVQPYILRLRLDNYKRDGRVSDRVAGVVFEVYLNRVMTSAEFTTAFYMAVRKWSRTKESIVFAEEHKWEPRIITPARVVEALMSAAVPALRDSLAELDILGITTRAIPEDSKDGFNMDTVMVGKPYKDPPTTLGQDEQQHSMVVAAKDQPYNNVIYQYKHSLN